MKDAMLRRDTTLALTQTRFVYFGTFTFHPFFTCILGFNLLF